MPLLNFQRQWANDVAAGIKTNSIRARKFMPGQRLYLYTGARTPACYKLGEAIVTASRAFSIDEHGYTLEQPDGTAYGYNSSMEFAQRDGFSGWADMVAFFREHYGIPQTRQLYFTQWSMVHSGQWRKGKSPLWIDHFVDANKMVDT